MTDTKTVKTVVVDAGKLKKRAIKELKAGAGPIAEQARAATAATAASGTKVVPVVILYEKRPKKRRGLLGGVLRKL